MNLEKLKAQWAALIAKADGIRANASEEERALTDEERTEFDECLRESDTVNQDIQRLEALAQANEQRTQREQEEQRHVTPQLRPDPAATVHDRAEDAPFHSFGEQLIAIRGAAEDRSSIDPRLRRYDLSLPTVRAAAGMNEAVASEGGFLLTTDTSSTLLQNAIQESQVWPRAQNIPLSGNSVGVKIPYVDETSRVDGSRFGGVRAYWKDEAETPTATKPKLGMIELSLKKLIALCYATDELIQDASALEAFVMRAFSEEFAFKLDDAAINGGGAGTPLGIMNCPAKVEVAKETSQAAATIQYANVSKMRARMLPRSFQRAVWFINVDCQPSLEQMFIPIKNVAGSENVGGQAVYVPPGGASQQPFGTLFGRPVVPIEQCQTVGTAGDIILADMGMYLTISRGGLQSASSIHVKFLTDETAYRFILRTDGQPAIKSAVTPFKGSNTQTAFIALATRS